MKNITDFVFRRQVGLKDVQSYIKFVESLLEYKATTPHANEPCELSGHCRATFLMDFSPDGSRMASSHGDHSVRITDIVTRKCTHILQGHPRTPWCLAFHPSANDILASGCLGGEVRIWDLHGRGSEVWTAPHGSVIATLAFHPTDHVLVFATADEIYFWDWSKSQPFACCKTARSFERVRWLCFDPLGHYLYTGIANNTTIQPRIHVGNRSSTGLRSDLRSRRRQIQERYQEVLRQYQNYERSQSEIPSTLDSSIPTSMGLDDELLPYVSLIAPQSPVHEDNLRYARQYAAEISEVVRGALDDARLSIQNLQDRPRRRQDFIGGSYHSAFYNPTRSAASAAAAAASTAVPSTSSSVNFSTPVSDYDLNLSPTDSSLQSDINYSSSQRQPMRRSSLLNSLPSTVLTNSSPADQSFDSHRLGQLGRSSSSSSNNNNNTTSNTDSRLTNSDTVNKQVSSDFSRPSRLLAWRPLPQPFRRRLLYKHSNNGGGDTDLPMPWMMRPSTASSLSASSSSSGNGCGTSRGPNTKNQSTGSSTSTLSNLSSSVLNSHHLNSSFPDPGSSPGCNGESTENFKSSPSPSSSTSFSSSGSSASFSSSFSTEDISKNNSTISTPVSSENIFPFVTSISAASAAAAADTSPSSARLLSSASSSPASSSHGSSILKKDFYSTLAPRPLSNSTSIHSETNDLFASNNNDQRNLNSVPNSLEDTKYYSLVNNKNNSSSSRISTNNDNKHNTDEACSESMPLLSFCPKCKLVSHRNQSKRNKDSSDRKVSRFSEYFSKTCSCSASVDSDVGSTSKKSLVSDKLSSDLAVCSSTNGHNGVYSEKSFSSLASTSNYTPTSSSSHSASVADYKWSTGLTYGSDKSTKTSLLRLNQKSSYGKNKNVTCNSSSSFRKFPKTFPAASLTSSDTPIMTQDIKNSDTTVPLSQVSLPGKNSSVWSRKHSFNQYTDSVKKNLLFNLTNSLKRPFSSSTDEDSHVKMKFPRSDQSQSSYSSNSTDLNGTSTSGSNTHLNSSFTPVSPSPSPVSSAEHSELLFPEIQNNNPASSAFNIADAGLSRASTSMAASVLKTPPMASTSVSMRLTPNVECVSQNNNCDEIDTDSSNSFIPSPSTTLNNTNCNNDNNNNNNNNNNDNNNNNNNSKNNNKYHNSELFEMQSCPTTTSGRMPSMSPFRSISMNNSLPQNLSERLDACKMNLQILETLSSTYRQDAANSVSPSIPATFTLQTNNRISPPPPLPDHIPISCPETSRSSNLPTNLLPSFSKSSSSKSEASTSIISESPVASTSGQPVPSTSSCSDNPLLPAQKKEENSESSNSSSTAKPCLRQAGALKSAFHSICRALSITGTTQTATEAIYTSQHSSTAIGHRSSLSVSTTTITTKPLCSVSSSVGNEGKGSKRPRFEANKRLDLPQKSPVPTISSSTTVSTDVNCTTTTTALSSHQSSETVSVTNSIPTSVSCATSSQHTPCATPIYSSSTSHSSSLKDSCNYFPLLPLTSSTSLPPHSPSSNLPRSTDDSRSFSSSSAFSCSSSQAAQSTYSSSSLCPSSVSTSSLSSPLASATRISPEKYKSSSKRCPEHSSVKSSHSAAAAAGAGNYSNNHGFDSNKVPHEQQHYESSTSTESESLLHSPEENLNSSSGHYSAASGSSSSLDSNDVSIQSTSNSGTSRKSHRPTKSSRLRLHNPVPSTSSVCSTHPNQGSSRTTRENNFNKSLGQCHKDSVEPQPTHSTTHTGQTSQHLPFDPSYAPNQYSIPDSNPNLSLLNWEDVDSSRVYPADLDSSDNLSTSSNIYDLPPYEESNHQNRRSFSQYPERPELLPSAHSISRPENPQGVDLSNSESLPVNINDNPGAATNEAFDTLCAVASATCDITEVTARLHQELDELDRRMASLQQRCAARLARVQVPSREVVNLERWSANHNVDEFVCSVRNTLDGIAQLRRHERLMHMQQLVSLPGGMTSSTSFGGSRLDESARLSTEAREEISRNLQREVNTQTKLLRLQERILQRLRQRQIHHHYVNTGSLEDASSRPSDTLQAAINRAIAGAFLGRGEIAVATNIINLTHRIQRWDFKKLELPDLTYISDNVIVPHCKLHNGASCDISQDGSLLATFVPTHRGFPDDTVLAIYSLQEDSLGQCLFTKGFGPNVISVSISPKNHYVLVGLAAKRISWVFTTNQMVAQIYQLSQEFAGEQSMKHVSDITHYVDADTRTHVSVNSAKWLPQVGAGLVYGTNRGNLHICWPGFKPVKKENPPEREVVAGGGEEEEWNTLNQAQSLRRNLYRMQHIRRNLINMPSVGQRLPHTTSTATQTSHRQVQRSAGTQTDGSEEEDIWDSD
ncbi:serine-rich adhesin for platelets-like [Octopus vulgaris]|uniref:Serine-rich adhesin for platelets-like n=1 Tax=Octopus vulgaris TaxID=6645 RepID=A0AA36FFT4_OCTVU|nr:serine-rich adhesin for platelets-like [Octopus vulgaris]